MLRLGRLLALTAIAALSAAALADTPRQLQWRDLVPPLPAGHPLAALSKQQLAELSDIAAARDRAARGEPPNDIAAKEAQAAALRLKQAGIDVDGLLARRAEFSEMQRLRLNTPNAALDGARVKIPGYLLPLEFSGKAITEFLLVPWVGACIHTPPPPPNQIVHVKSARPIENASLFAPVWVTGRLSAGASKQSLYLVDGSSDIDIAYSLQAESVLPYKQ